jgi:hypothetical protein
MQTGHKGHRPSSVPVRAQPTDLVLHNSQESLPGQFNSSIETHRHDKQVRSGPSNFNDSKAEAVRGVLEGADAVDLSEFGQTTGRTSAAGDLLPDWSGFSGSTGRAMFATNKQIICRVSKPLVFSKDYSPYSSKEPSEQREFSIEAFWFHSFSLLRAKADSIWIYIHQNEVWPRLGRLEDTACACCPSSFSCP